MELLAGAGNGIVNLLRAAEDGEQRAYWAAVLLSLYIVVATGVLVYCWSTGRLLEGTRNRVGYTLAYSISIGSSCFVLYGIVSRLMT